MPNLSLIDALQTYLSRMSPAELKAFRRALRANLPGFLETTFEEARQAAERSSQPVHTASSPAGAIRKRRRS